MKKVDSFDYGDINVVTREIKREEEYACMLILGGIIVGAIGWIVGRDPYDHLPTIVSVLSVGCTILAFVAVGTLSYPTIKKLRKLQEKLRS